MESFLDKPLAFIDLESTGISITEDRICQIAIEKIFPNGKENEKFDMYFNPTKPMQLEAAEITGLTDDMLKDYPLFKDQAPAVSAFLYGCDLAGHNIMRFDLPLLVEEMIRAGIHNFPEPGTMFVDTHLLMAKIMPRTLEFSYEYLTGNKFDSGQAHGAAYDAFISSEVYKKQVEKHENLLGPNRNALHDISTYGRKIVDFSGKFTVNEKGLVIFNFGKHQGKRVTYDLQYLQWMLKGDFTADTKRWIHYCIKHQDDYYAQFKTEKTE